MKRISSPYGLRPSECRSAAGCLSGLMLAAGTAQAAPPAPATGNHWVLTFEDTFQGTSLDSTKWSKGYSWGRTHNHKAYMAPENVRVENGRMIITAEAKRHPLAPYSVNHDGYHVVDYTSGAINTSGKFNFTHGYVEGRFKLATGTGTWPAFWTLQGGWPPEIDIFENLNGSNTFYTNYHWGTWNNHSSYFNTHTGGNLNSTFRTYGLDWKAGSMGWYYENGRVALLNNSSAISAAANNYLIINLAVGGWPGTPNPAHYPTTFECEWVRVWKQVAAPARRLTGHWRLDEKHPGPVNDATGNGDGNLINAPLTGGSGPAGDGAFDFPGTNQAVNTNRSSLVPASGDFTLTVNFKTRGTHTPQGHLLSNNNFQAGRCALFVENGLLKWWHHLGASLSSTNRVDDGAWHRADLVRMGNEWSLWLDGQVVDSGISDAAISQTQAWFIGRANQANFSYNGLISDVKVWNHARGVGSKIHHWPLDENPGTFTGTHALADQSSPSAPATLAAPEDETDLVRFNEPGATPDSGGSILLGGRYERIELGNVSPREEPFTLSFWFKSKAFRRWEADQDHILSSNGGQSGRWNIHLYGDPAYLSQNGGPMLQFFHDGYGAVTLDPVVTPGTWNHVAIVRDENAGENFRIYLNGGLVHTGTNQLDFTDSPMGVLAGRRPSSPMSSGFEGWIDDIRFHHGAVDGRINELAGGGYDKWARSRFGANAGEPGTLASDDPDGAGITNFQRYTFGTDGGSEYGQSARMPGGTPGGAVNLEFRVRPDPTIRYFIQSTTSLDAWNSLGFRYRNPAWVPDDPAAMRLTPIDTVDGTVTLEATLPPAAPATPARFVRIKAMMPATKAP